MEAAFLRLWWQPARTLAAQLLRPLSWLYRLLFTLAHLRRPATLPVPVVVVGNLVVGGAGKTPATIALVRALRDAGWQPGIVSRGHGRADGSVRRVTADSRAAETGDEPRLLQRATGRPVFVGHDRVAAARALLAAEPGTDVLVSDDGLQHAALPRLLQVVVFDERGVGNGLLLPAGPLRQPLPAQVPARTWVLYNAAAPSTPLPGVLARRSLSWAIPWPAWQEGTRRGAVPIAGLRGPALLAVAGIAAPERFFAMLEAAGLTIERLALPDHHPYATLPWPAGTAEVVLTEKDAVKLAGHDLGATKVWVVPLDFLLPEPLVAAMLAALRQHRLASAP